MYEGPPHSSSRGTNKTQQLRNFPVFLLTVQLQLLARWLLIRRSVWYTPTLLPRRLRSRGLWVLLGTDGVYLAVRIHSCARPRLACVVLSATDREGRLPVAGVRASNALVLDWNKTVTPVALLHLPAIHLARGCDR